VTSPIRQASAATRTALEVSRRGRSRQQRRAQALQTIDRVIERVEEVNLSGAGFDPLRGVSLRALEETFGELPASVRGAPTPVDLHEALLDWQEQLMDRAFPARQSFREVDAEIDPPEPQRRRRRRRPPVGLRSAA
jgi:hypothetical protein